MSYSNYDVYNRISFDDKQLEFSYKLQYEEPRVKVVSSDSDSDVDNLLFMWNKDYEEDIRKLYLFFNYNAFYRQYAIWAYTVC